jgi:hypothetical protein
VDHRGNLVDPPLFAPVRIDLNSAPPRPAMYFDHFRLCKRFSESADSVLQHCFRSRYFADRAGCLLNEIILSSFNIGDVEAVTEQEVGFDSVQGRGVHPGSSFQFAGPARGKLVLDPLRVGLGPAQLVLPGAHQAGCILLSLLPQSQDRF